jgi:heavy metal-(Cd/Co/Hg/Pb/Zn)-translocating P-type ATPase
MTYEIILILIIGVGLVKIIIDSGQNILKGRYSLDYIAFVTMVLSLVLGQYIAGAIIALMFIGGEALESFASSRAYRALKKLSDTIPKKCFVEQTSGLAEVPIQDVLAKQIILVKRNEIVPLDGIILSPHKAIFNLANLTGEVGPVTLNKGTFIKSGSINTGEIVRLQVVGDFSSSAYQKIVGLVEDAKSHPAKTVRMSERANFYFTLATLVIAGLTYAITGDLIRLLAVLVIATPCPLIIAAPAAFVSGMSRVARSGIILRRPAALEGINNASVIFFDKTGTLTLGEPVLSSTDISDEILGIAAGLEIHSLHPLARTIVSEARRRKIRFPIARDVQEELGKGISGTIGGERYLFSGVSLVKNGTEIARFRFDDVLKNGAVQLISRLKAQGIRTAIITGDKKQNAEKVFGDTEIDIYASQSPTGKFRLIKAAKKKGETVVMIGDGLNDAPALATADVGIVFSGTENGATIDAADVAILGSGLEKVDELFKVSRHTMRVARQSIYGGIGFSVIGMMFAAFGYITPIHGALLQETIDIIVILNALRALTKY